MDMDDRFDPRIQRRDRTAVKLRQRLSDRDLELGDLLTHMSDASNDLARREVQRKLVRVVHHADVVHLQIAASRDLCRGGNGSREV